MTETTALRGLIDPLAAAPPILRSTLGQLIAYVETIERLEAKKAKAYADAARHGFSVQALETVIQTRRRLAGAGRAARGAIPRLYSAAIDLDLAALDAPLIAQQASL